MKDLTVERLRALLTYDPATGIFRWKNKRGCKAADSVAGTPHKEGRYVQIMIDRRAYSAHRLAWTYAYGAAPEQEIDHVNGEGKDNRLCNLRLVSREENMQNQRKAHKNSQTKVLGVSLQDGKYRPRLHVKGKSLSFGLFDTLEEAYGAYLDKKREYHGGCTL